MRKIAGGILAIAVVALLLVASDLLTGSQRQALATHVTPDFRSGNPTCETLSPGSIEFKVEPVEDGTFSDGTLTVTIDVRDTADGEVFDFITNIGVDAVFAKGSNEGNLYTYQTPTTGTESRGDTGLHAPVNESGKYADLSHVSFCYDITPSIDVEKTPSQTQVCAGSGTSVVYTYVVTNNGDVALTGVTVTDDKIGSLTADFTAANGGSSSLAVGAQVTFTKTVPISETVTNEVTASATGAGRTVTDMDAATVTAMDCDIEVTKTPSVTQVCGGAGQSVTYTFVVTNAGDVTLTDIAVTDDVLGSIGTVTSLAPGATATFTKTHAVNATTTNTVTATGNALGLTPADTDTATATVTAMDCDIEVTKSVTPTQFCAGTSASVTYTFIVTNEGNVTLTGVVLTDDVLGAIGTVASLAPGASVTFTVTTTVNATVTNTVTATGNALGATPADTDTATATVTAMDCDIEVTKTPSTTTVCGGQGVNVTYTYVVTNAGDVTLTGITVNDDKLGDLTADFVAANGGSSSLASGASVTFTKTVSINETTTNTVTVSGNALGSTPADTDTATATVTAIRCFQGCTPGFYKQEHHLDSWVVTGFSPNQKLNTVFANTGTLGEDTLLTALNYGGGNTLTGAKQILLRAAVAALLNSANPDVDYPRTTAEVIADVNAALATGNRNAILALARALDADNNLGCPLS